MMPSKNETTVKLTEWHLPVLRLYISIKNRYVLLIIYAH